MRKIKRITSVILAALMIVSLFAAVPMTVNAAPPDSGSGTGTGGSTTVITPAADGDYLTFTAVEANSSVTLKVASCDYLQYNKNNSGWVDYSVGSLIALASAGDSVRFRGGNTKFNSSNHVSIGGKVACSGNVMSLRLDNYGEVQGLSSRCFNYMFKDCAGLTAAPELPETTLADYCYDRMFIGCTNLTAAPELPATTLAPYCYNYMFSGCERLTTAPELPATSLANYCYSYMFSGCRSLTTAPELPATSLAYNCYNSMFDGCASLTTAPELPATSLANYCYYGMFNGCGRLTTAPELPATSLAQNCYYNMFEDCDSLTTAPVLPATSLAYNCYSSMFEDCESLTTAPVLPATSLAYGCYNSMFSGCTSLTTAPELPATELASHCYDSMFMGCTSLTTPPELPATELTSYCYRSMFEGCSSIKLSETKIAEYSIPYSVPSGENGTTASSALDDMFAGTGGTFKGDPEINKTYYMYREYDYTTTGNNGYYFDDAVEVGSGDTLATLNGYSSLFNFKILGVQKKADVDVLSSDSKKDVRFVSVVKTDILKDADEYGYVFAKFDSKEDARNSVDNEDFTAHSSKVLTKVCTTTSNTISGDYGLYNEDTNYKYVTATVNGIGDDTVAARFYIRKGSTYYYADYTNEQNQTYGVCAAAYSDLK